MSNHTYEASPYLTGPAYIYITSADGLPSPQQAGDDSDAIARVKLFDPNGAWTWYVAGYDPETRIAWAWSMASSRNTEASTWPSWSPSAARSVRR